LELVLLAVIYRKTPLRAGGFLSGLKRIASFCSVLVLYFAFSFLLFHFILFFFSSFSFSFFIKKLPPLPPCSKKIEREREKIVCAHQGTADNPIIGGRWLTGGGEKRETGKRGEKKAFYKISLRTLHRHAERFRNWGFMGCRRG